MKVSMSYVQFLMPFSQAVVGVALELLPQVVRYSHKLSYILLPIPNKLHIEITSLTPSSTPHSEISPSTGRKA
jgi:hypothetical protein